MIDEPVCLLLESVHRDTNCKVPAHLFSPLVVRHSAKSEKQPNAVTLILVPFCLLSYMAVRTQSTKPVTKPFVSSRHDKVAISRFTAIDRLDQVHRTSAHDDDTVDQGLKHDLPALGTDRG